MVKKNKMDFDESFHPFILIFNELHFIYEFTDYFKFILQEFYTHRMLKNFFVVQVTLSLFRKKYLKKKGYYK